VESVFQVEVAVEFAEAFVGNARRVARGRQGLAGKNLGSGKKLMNGIRKNTGPRGPVPCEPMTFSLEALHRYPIVSRVSFVECRGNGAPLSSKEPIQATRGQAPLEPGLFRAMDPAFAVAIPMSDTRPFRISSTGDPDSPRNVSHPCVSDPGLSSGALIFAEHPLWAASRNGRSAPKPGSTICASQVLEKSASLPHQIRKFFQTMDRKFIVTTSPRCAELRIGGRPQ
jgi:hypothetical protein